MVPCKLSGIRFQHFVFEVIPRLTKNVLIFLLCNFDWVSDFFCPQGASQNGLKFHDGTNFSHWDGLS